MKTLFSIVLCIVLLPAYAAESKPGQYLGSRTSERPTWFKESFLEFKEDVAEAAAHNKRVMIYFHQEGCPYCAKLVEENFADPETEAFMRKHYEAIEVNMWGDRDIVSIGGKKFTEKTFAAALKVQYTPTVLFLNEQGNTVLRLNGYYPAEKFRLALRYVAEKQESNQSFNEYVLANSKPSSGLMIGEDFFLDPKDLNALLNSSDKYLAVYFEAPGCDDCDVLHSKVLADAATRKLAMQMNSVQLNVYSDEKIIGPDGLSLSARDYARELNIGYLPSVVFYSPRGEEVHRIEGFVKTFHFQSTLAYVLEQGYLSQPSFQRYISARGEKLREQGFDTDIWGYRSLHPADIAPGEGRTH